MNRDQLAEKIIQIEQLQQYPEPELFETNELPAVNPEIIPGILRDMCLAVSEEKQVPFELALVNGLGVVSAVGQGKFKTRVRQGLTEPINLFALCPLPPGNRKSPTVKTLKQPIVDWEMNQAAKMKAEVEEVKSDRKIIESKLAYLRRELPKKKDPDASVMIEKIKRLEMDMPDIPVIPRLLCDNFTVEAIAALMEKHDERIALIEAEGGIFENLAGLYSNGTPQLDPILKSHNSESIRFDRRGSDPILLNNPHLTFIISPQPEVVAQLAEKPGFLGRGLIPRFLFFIPKSTVGYRKIEPEPIPQETKDGYTKKINSLMSIPWARDQHGNKTHYTLSLDPKAYRLWIDFSGKIETELREGGELEGLTDWSSKLAGLTVRIASLFHLSIHDAPYTERITAETMGRAIQLASVAVEHTKAAYDLFGCNEDESHILARDILKWILELGNNQFTGRDCLMRFKNKRIRGRRPKMNEIKAALEVLKGRNILTFKKMKTTGRPTTFCEVNPKVFDAAF